MKNTNFSYSNEKLINYSNYLLAKYNFKKKIILAPIFNWTSENSSYGKIFRKKYYYPELLPLFLSSDHSITICSKYLPAEKKTPSTYLTWNFEKYKIIKKNNRDCYYIEHPYIYYFKNKFHNKNRNRCNGTIVFLPHSSDNLYPKYNLNNYLKKINKLPNKFKPISICLSALDIKNNLGLIKILKRKKLNIITIGNTNSYFFVDNFYKIVSKFKYATSLKNEISPGSHFFYTLLIGVPFFFYGGDYKNIIKKKNPDLKNFGTQRKNDFNNEKDFKELEKIYKSFSIKKISTCISREQIEILNQYTGFGAKENRLNLSFILWKNFIFNIHNCFYLWFCSIIYSLKKKFN